MCATLKSQKCDANVVVKRIDASLCGDCGANPNPFDPDRINKIESMDSTECRDQ
jgi:hypothetical protein